jgi:hypothetical protein
VPGLCGSPFDTGTQLVWPGLGSLENATLSIWVTPLETFWPKPVKSAGLPISQIAATQASTIQIVPSMVRLARLRISPFQASHITPSSTTGTR